ncbi:DUF262 domain-containing protein [Rheinheimera sp.]|uniref:DUF262 domain-containing protein n=1 Tax=Rheinheimera sp. TaxID=1869214 RepID=UPI002FDEA447
MNLLPLTPNVYSVFREIEKGSIDLDPEFQRGDVWAVKKQQMLIDTILRKWQIPPIFFIRNKNTNVKEVLDGHQRLRAIQNFFLGKFPINGSIEPIDDFIKSLDGLYYSELPNDILERLENFPLFTYEVENYVGSEPFELFFRLNQNTQLTSAERRNTLFGKAREQVKSLVEFMGGLGFCSTTIGFNNTRQSYDDVVARALMALEYSDLSKKINDSEITSKFREDNGFRSEIYIRVSDSIAFLSKGIRNNSIKLNKPALISLIIFLCTCENRDEVQLNLLLNVYRRFLQDYKYSLSPESREYELMSREYQNRISVSVNDGKALVFRQFFFCWLCYKHDIRILSFHYSNLVEPVLFSLDNFDSSIAEYGLPSLLKDKGWEQLKW